MINVKDEVYTALTSEEMQEITKNVSDGYPKEWAVLPAIEYTEEDNSVYEWTSEGEEKSHLLYRVDIWNNTSTSQAALAVDKALSALGLRRKQCNDVEDPTGLKHKVMRYEGIIDVNSRFVYNN